MPISRSEISRRQSLRAREHVGLLPACLSHALCSATPCCLPTSAMPCHAIMLHVRTTFRALPWLAAELEDESELRLAESLHCQQQIWRPVVAKRADRCFMVVHIFAGITAILAHVAILLSSRDSTVASWPCQLLVWLRHAC